MKKYFVLLWVVFSAQLSAVEVSGLYQARVMVDSQAQAQREKALSSSLAKVLVKVAGRQDVLGNTRIKQALGRPSSYLKEYRYQAMPQSAKQALWVQFDDTVINRLLDDAGVQPWGRARPSVLLWLAVEDPGQQQQRSLVGGGGSQLQGRLAAQAQERGLPLLLPLLDSTDQTQLSVSDVWGGFLGALSSASLRYDADAVLSGRASRTTGGQWRVKWLLQAKERVQQWSTGAAGLLSALDDGIGSATDRLAELYLQDFGGYSGEQLEMAVVGIRDVQGYARVSHYLNGLDVVERASVLHAEVDRISFLVEAPHGQAAVEQAIALGDTLRREPGELDWIFRPASLTRPRMIHPQIPLLLPMGGQAGFSNYIPGPNAAILHHLEQVCREQDGENIYLWGAEGTGKTHLLEAALGACRTVQRPAAYIPISLDGPEPLRPEMLEGLEQMRLVCIDGLDGIAGFGPWEEALFHLYNRCRTSSCVLLLAARAAPAGLGLQLADLQSRLLAGLVMHLQPLNDAQRVEALQTRARERGFVIPSEAAAYLIRRYPRGLHSLFSSLDRLDQATLAQQRKVTIPFLRELLDGG